MPNLTKQQKAVEVLRWRKMFPVAEGIAPRSEMREGIYCFGFKSLEVSVYGHHRQIMARVWDNTRVDFAVERNRYNDRELFELEEDLRRRKVIPVTIGYASGGRMGSIRQMHYVAIPTLGEGKRSKQYVFI